MASFRDIKSDRYFRFSYDNDFFTAMDENYTQGYNIELVMPFLKKNPANYLFFKPKNSMYKYGLSWEHIGFTPDNYTDTAIQYGDRPFASAFMFKSFAIATNTNNAARFTSSFSWGMLGPAAFGNEMQTEIHRATGNVLPKGWRNQIENHVVINYEVGYEKMLVQLGQYFRINANTNVQAGTLFTNASVGVNMIAGIINKPFTPTADKSKFALYVYAQPVGKVVGFDATLQGGLIGDESIYKITSADMQRFTGQLNYGLVLQTGVMFFEYSQSFQTKEYSFGNNYRYGGVKFGFRF